MVSSLAGSVTCSKLLLRHMFQRQGAMRDSLPCIAEALQTNKTTHRLKQSLQETVGAAEQSLFVDGTAQSVLQGGTLYRAAAVVTRPTTQLARL